MLILKEMTEAGLTGETNGATKKRIGIGKEGD
jgi:hypothetical protein